MVIFYSYVNVYQRVMQIHTGFPGKDCGSHNDVEQDLAKPL